MLLSVYISVSVSVYVSFGRMWHTVKVCSGGALLLRHTVGTVVLNTWWKRQKSNEGGY